MSENLQYNDPVVTMRTVFARNCEVKKVDRKTADAFLAANHIYGSASCRDCYGLFRRRVTGASETAASAGELVAVATFSNARRWEKQGRCISSYEWVRYASLRDTRVVGGMGKLLKAFIDERHPDDVMTYAISTAVPGRELREGVESEGNVYRKLGFIEESRHTFLSRLPQNTAADSLNTAKETDVTASSSSSSSSSTSASSIPARQLSTSIKFRLKLTPWE